MKKYMLSIDQGTTSSRCMIFDAAGNTVSMAQQEFRQIYPREGWVEHAPLDIISSVMATVAEALARAHLKARDIAGIGVTNQRETTVVWDRETGEPVYNAIVWQCRRTAPYCESLKGEGVGDEVYRRTGLRLDAYFSATKIRWILDNVEGARERAERGELLFGTVETYVMWHLSGGEVHATDYTNAARTMLFNIHTLTWDDDLLSLFGIPRSMLPGVFPSGHVFGYTDEKLLGASIPLCGAAGDQQSALFGQLCVNRGDMKCTYGTGCFLLVNAGDSPVESSNGLVTTLGASLGEDRPPYVLEGSVFVGGAAVQWLRDEMRLIPTAADSEAEARKSRGDGGVYVVPAFTGLGAPYWDPDARGMICGITRGTTREDIVRAVLEGIAYQVHDVARAMEKDLGGRITALRVDGGASRNDFLMGFQSDILRCDIVRPRTTETTAAGAAYLAGLTCGYWSSLDEIRRNAETDRVFRPGMDEEERRARLAGWRRAVARCLSGD